MREYNHPMPLCQCIDWGTADFIVWFNHIIRNFDFLGFELEYQTLDGGTGCRLCEIGRCRVCGKRMCIGGKLLPQDTADHLVEEVYRQMMQMWKGFSELLPEREKRFEDTFVSLFHECDREHVYELLLSKQREVE